MRVMIIGSGAREHALAWALAASPLCDKLFAAPGNAGIARLAECLAVSDGDLPGLVAAARANKVDFAVVGPEAPLVAGVVDALEAGGIAAFGPNRAAAALEGSKGFMKDFCARHSIPTARYARFTAPEPARAYVRQYGAPIVVKTDGLAAGKGVTVAMTVDEAIAAIDAFMIGRRFGAAGAEIVIEEFLAGEEASFFALCDGKNAIALGAAQDHKRAFDGDQGPNTGGMGTYAPPPVFTDAIRAQVMDRIVRPTLAGMAAKGRPFKGFLFCGLMIDKGEARLIEFNVRFGDPEAETLIPLMKSDLLPGLVAARDGVLDRFDMRWWPGAALTVVMAAKGYPEAGQAGTLIRNLAAAEAVPDVTIFHAGTKAAPDGVIAGGGRTLAVTARGPDLRAARTRAYQAVAAIEWPGGFNRTDIGWRALDAS